MDPSIGPLAPTEAPSTEPTVYDSPRIPPLAFAQTIKEYQILQILSLRGLALYSLA